MDLTAWALYAFIAVLVLAGTFLHYRWREPSGRGRPVLAGLRGAALALLVLLLFNPAFPDIGTARQPSTVVLVDGSLSMRLPGPDGRTRWEEARSALALLDPDRVLVFGGGQAVPVASLEGMAPVVPTSRLAPALGAALEAGAGRVVVVTDAAIDDGGDVERLVQTRGLPFEVVRVGERTAGNLGLSELDPPGWARWGEESAVHVGISRLGAPVPDSVTVTLRWQDRELASVVVQTPAEGRTAQAALRFMPPEGMEGLVRVDASIEGTDVELADDHRSAYVTVAERPAGVTLVSFRPDQEPRFLLPVLERALGLPARGWLALGTDRFIRLGSGPEAGLTDPASEVRRALDEAGLVVLHGLAPGLHDWALAAARSQRVLVFPSEPLPQQVVGVEVSAADPGEWYVVEEIPASPVAPFLGAIPPAVPPLTALRPAALPGGWWWPLEARQGRRGEAAPVLVAGDLDGRRVAVAVGEGFWRWAFAGDGGRTLYDAFWSGVAAWLMEAEAEGRVEEVRPDPRVVARGTPVRWVVPPEADSLRVRLTRVSGPVGRPVPEEEAEPPALDTTVAVVDGRATQAAPQPGHYRYEAVARTEERAWRGVGELTIERYSPEFTRPARPMEGLATGWTTSPERGPARGRPLRSSPWPYLALVGLLCMEWILRRRWGLR